MPASAFELPFTSVFPTVRSNKIAWGAYRGYLTFRNVLGRLFTFAMEPIITELIPVTGATVTATPLVSQESVFLTPAGTLATLTFTLPSAVNSRVGMIRRLQSTQTLTALTINVDQTGVVAGAALTAGVINTPYAWQCKSIAGTVATWHRIH